MVKEINYVKQCRFIIENLVDTFKKPVCVLLLYREVQAGNRTAEERIQEELMHLFVSLLACRKAYGVDQPSVFGRKHIDQNFLYFILVLEVGDYCFRTESDRLVGCLGLFLVDSCRWIGVLYVHLLWSSSGLMSIQSPFFDYVGVSWVAGGTWPQTVIRIVVRMVGSLWIVDDDVLSDFIGQSFEQGRDWVENLV